MNEEEVSILRAAGKQASFGSIPTTSHDLEVVGGEVVYDEVYWGEGRSGDGVGHRMLFPTSEITKL